MPVLTHHREVHGVADRWCGAHLTLVEARISPLWVANLQHPVFCLWRVDGLETLVARVRVSPDSQKVDVSVSNPRHLQTKGKDQTCDALKGEEIQFFSGMSLTIGGVGGRARSIGSNSVDVLLHT